MTVYEQNVNLATVAKSKVNQFFEPHGSSFESPIWEMSPVYLDYCSQSQEEH